MTTRVAFLRRTVIAGGEADSTTSPREGPGGPDVVASFRSYREAQRAVDLLSDRKFPVEHVRIVAEGLRLVEQVTGRLTWWRAVGRGLLGGAVTGAFIGILFGLFVIDRNAWLNLVLYGLAFGALVGALFGLLGYAVSGGERDFSSVGGFAADRYDVAVDREHAADARAILSEPTPRS